MAELHYEEVRKIADDARLLDNESKLRLINDHLARAGVLIDAIVNGGSGPTVVMVGWDPDVGGRTQKVRLQRNVMQAFIEPTRKIA